MNKKIKIVLITLVVELFIATIIFMYIAKYSKDAKQGHLNWRKIEQVKIGMDIDQVNRIMNEPDTLFTINNDKLWHHEKKVFSYYKGPGIYGQLQVIIDPSADTVIQVVKIME